MFRWGIDTGRDRDVDRSYINHLLLRREERSSMKTRLYGGPFILISVKHSSVKIEKCKKAQGVCSAFDTSPLTS